MSAYPGISAPPQRGGIDPALYASNASVGDIYGAPTYVPIPYDTSVFSGGIQIPVSCMLRDDVFFVRSYSGWSLEWARPFLLIYKPRIGRLRCLDPGLDLLRCSCLACFNVFRVWARRLPTRIARHARELVYPGAPCETRIQFGVTFESLLIWQRARAHDRARIALMVCDQR